MKKILFICTFLLLLVGCNKAEVSYSKDTMTVLCTQDLPLVLETGEEYPAPALLEDILYVEEGIIKKVVSHTRIPTDYYYKHYNVSTTDEVITILSDAQKDITYEHDGVYPEVPYEEDTYIIYPYLIEDFSNINNWKDTSSLENVLRTNHGDIIFDSYYKKWIEEHPGYACEIIMKQVK